MNKKIILILLIVMVGLVYGQQNYINKISFYGGIGAGVSGVAQSHFHNSLQYTIGLRHNHLSAKYLFINNVESVIRNVFNTTTQYWDYPQESIDSKCFQLGYTVNIKKKEVPEITVGYEEVNFTFYVGFLRYISVKRGEIIREGISTVYYHELEENGFGFPLELEIEWRFNNNFGVTTSMHAELNKSQSYVGLLVNMFVGYY